MDEAGNVSKYPVDNQGIYFDDFLEHNIGSLAWRRTLQCVKYSWEGTDINNVRPPLWFGKVMDGWMDG